MSNTFGLVGHINEVNLRRARLVLGWVTVSAVQVRMQENLCQDVTIDTHVNLAWPSLRM